FALRDILDEIPEAHALDPSRDQIPPGNEHAPPPRPQQPNILPQSGPEIEAPQKSSAFARLCAVHALFAYSRPDAARSRSRRLFWSRRPVRVAAPPRRAAPPAPRVSARRAWIAMMSTERRRREETSRLTSHNPQVISRTNDVRTSVLAQRI